MNAAKCARTGGTDAATQREVLWLRASIVAPLVMLLLFTALGAWPLLALVGLPYSLFAALMLAVLWQRPAAAYYSTAKIAPPLYVPFQATVFAVPDVLAGQSPIRFLEASVLVSLYVIPIGYAFVAALFLIRWHTHRSEP